MTVEECAFESHLEYFDVQYVVEGEECFGYEPDVYKRQKTVPLWMSSTVPAYFP